MQLLSLLYLSAVAYALSIQPRQFGGGFRGPPNFGNGDITNGNFPQDNANNDANNGVNNGVNNADGANQDAGNQGNNGANDGVNNGVDNGASDDTNNGANNGDNQGNNGTNNGDGNGNDQTAGDGAAGGGDTTAADGQTVVFTETNGVPGNECLTFRNNGEIVDAACVNEAIDRQITPTTVNGQNALQVQRTFTPDFRADLVNVQACVGFNGTHFRAEDCNAQGVEPVTFQNGQLVASGGACASGHDDAAQMTVDTSGAQCATYTTTDVQPAAA
ncbi:hypothetical protein FSARC_10097 [Fusarium sarcochroum]|uniref:Uncharacterized protein n=1 Tax=Fusarium sarcochroum TaxID=1208366 RepID=A0A8H4X5K1_9HYPO|nr:hypothetical protein FSARC_10097 [Fusarium sarcochroum]